MCVINVSNKRKTGKWRKICLFPAGFEPATLCVWGTRDNRYTMETCYVCRLLFGFHITGWLPKKWKKLSSHLGVEPRTFGLEVQRAIHCANGTPGILGSAFSKFIEYTRYWRLDTIYSSRYWKVRYVGIREYLDTINSPLIVIQRHIGLLFLIFPLTTETTNFSTRSQEGLFLTFRMGTSNARNKNLRPLFNTNIPPISGKYGLRNHFWSLESGFLMRKREENDFFSKSAKLPILSFWILNVHIIICQFQKRSTVIHFFSLSPCSCH